MERLLDWKVFALMIFMSLIVVGKPI